MLEEYSTRLEATYDRLAAQLDARKGPDGGVVYHYTDAFGLEGILRSGKIRATDYRFLNDRSEFKHGIENAKSLCGKLAKGTKDQRLRNFLHLTEHFLGVPDEQNRSFVASFSERRDDLSQWRGYANEGQGYTLGFDADWFTTKCLHDDCEFAFAKVSYSGEKFRSSVAKIINDFFELVPPRTPSRQREEAAEFCDLAIEGLCAVHKHHSFSAEVEWRLISYLSDDDLKDIQVRPKSSGLVPFTDIDLRNDDGKLPLHSIGIGPSISNAASSQAVLDLCRMYSYECDIYNAETPFQRI